jgi:hypothetical protein
MVEDEKDLITPPEEEESKEGDKEKEGGEAPPEKTVPQSKLDAANKKIAEMGGRITELTDTLISPDFLKREATPATKEEGEKEPTEEDLENMSRKEYAAHIANKTIAAVGVLVSNLVQRQEFFETKKAQDDTITKYPDYWDYKDAMIPLSKQYPGVSPEDIYLIACGKKNPPVKPPVPKATSSEKPGITTEFKDKKLSPEEAAKIAWNRTMGNK